VIRLYLSELEREEILQKDITIKRAIIVSDIVVAVVTTSHLIDTIYSRPSLLHCASSPVKNWVAAVSASEVGRMITLCWGNPSSHDMYSTNRKSGFC